MAKMMQLDSGVIVNLDLIAEIPNTNPGVKRTCLMSWGQTRMIHISVDDTERMVKKDMRSPLIKAEKVRAKEEAEETLKREEANMRLSNEKDKEDAA